MHRRIPGTLALAALTAVGACASTKKPPTPRPVFEPCDGQAVLIIENGSGYELDVVEARQLSGAHTVIATVGNGYHEVLVRREGGYSYFTQRVRGRTPMASESSTRSAASDEVRMRRECRPR